MGLRFEEHDGYFFTVTPFFVKQYDSAEEREANLIRDTNEFFRKEHAESIKEATKERLNKKEKAHMNNTYDVYVVGMRKEYFVDMLPGDEAFDATPGENERYILFCTTFNGRVKFTIELYTSHGWCGSGYTTASWGNMHIKVVDDFGPATHMPKERKLKLDGAMYDPIPNGPIENGIILDASNSVGFMDFDYYNVFNNVFTYRHEGVDDYYPSGSVYVNEDLFDELPRAMDRRPIWIFCGPSGTGKSTLAHYLRSFEPYAYVYETDSANNGDLPKEIWADIIVVGNKWKNITVDAVKERIPKNTKPIIVTFDYDISFNEFQ